MKLMKKAAQAVEGSTKEQEALENKSDGTENAKKIQNQLSCLTI